MTASFFVSLYFLKLGFTFVEYLGKSTQVQPKNYLITVQSRFSDIFDLCKNSLNCMMSLNQMILCSILKKRFCKTVTKSQFVTKFDVTKSRLHCTYILKFKFMNPSMYIATCIYLTIGTNCINKCRHVCPSPYNAMGSNSY